MGSPSTSSSPESQVEWDCYSPDAAVGVEQVDLVALDVDVSEGDVVQSHDAVLDTHHLTPLGDVEGGNTWALLGRPYLPPIHTLSTHAHNTALRQVDQF